MLSVDNSTSKYVQSKPNHECCTNGETSYADTWGEFQEESVRGGWAVQDVLWEAGVLCQDVAVQKN